MNPSVVRVTFQNECSGSGGPDIGVRPLMPDVPLKFYI